MEHHYTEQLITHSDKIQIIIIRDDGLTASSTWWEIDDGSAQAEAWDNMRKLEAEPKEKEVPINPTTIHEAIDTLIQFVRTIPGTLPDNVNCAINILLIK